MQTNADHCIGAVWTFGSDGQFETHHVTHRGRYIGIIRRLGSWSRWFQARPTGDPQTPGSQVLQQGDCM